MPEKGDLEGEPISPEQVNDDSAVQDAMSFMSEKMADLEGEENRNKAKWEPFDREFRVFSSVTITITQELSHVPEIRKRAFQDELKKIKNEQYRDYIECLQRKISLAEVVERMQQSINKLRALQIEIESATSITAEDET